MHHPPRLLDSKALALLLGWQANHWTWKLQAKEELKEGGGWKKDPAPADQTDRDLRTKHRRWNGRFAHGGESWDANREMPRLTWSGARGQTWVKGSLDLINLILGLLDYECIKFSAGPWTGNWDNCFFLQTLWRPWSIPFCLTLRWKGIIMFLQSTKNSLRSPVKLSLILNISETSAFLPIRYSLSELMIIPNITPDEKL